MKLSRSLVPDLTALQSFEAAARHGSFTRAAVELNLTQSAVSRQIKDLEAQLGVALFERVRQRVVLSNAGLRLLPDVERLIAQIEALTLRAAGSRDVSGHLTIATLPTFGNRWLMPRLPDFLALHPGVQVTVATRDRPFDLAEAGVDIAIHYGQPVWPGASCTYLCSETLVPGRGAAPARHAVRAGPSAAASGIAPDAVARMAGIAERRSGRLSRPSVRPVRAVDRGGAGGHGGGADPDLSDRTGIARGAPRHSARRPPDDRGRLLHRLPEDHASDPLCNAFGEWVCTRVR